MPGMHGFPIDGYFVDMSLVEEEWRPTKLVRQTELNRYTDLLTLKRKDGGKQDFVGG